MVNILRICILFIVSAVSIGQTTIDIEGFHKTSNKFAESYNACIELIVKQEANSISPYSPDYWDGFMSCWVTSGASDEFGKLERQINDISWLLGRKGR